MGDNEQDLSYLLEPYDGLTYTTRNATEKSKTANALVASFLASPGSVAVVRHEQTRYTFDELYNALRNVCRKKPLRRLVSVSKRDHRMYLLKNDVV